MLSSKDLAKELGVSPSAISLALNDRSGISDKTRAKILAAAEKYGITRREKLVKAETNYINLVIYKKHGLVFGDTPFFSSLIEEMSAYTSNLKYNLQVTYFYANQPRNEQIRSINSSGCIGVILLATEMLADELELATKIKMPVVILDSYFESADFNCVTINNVQGAYKATAYLFNCGHRRIGHIASSVDINNFRERHEGYLKAVEEYNEASDCRDTVIRVTSTTDGAYEDMKKYLQGKPQLATAYFVDNDIIAASCMRALKESGYHIPNDISIIGFDNLPFTYVVSPKLTTMDVPKESLAIHAVRRLMDIINGDINTILKIEVNTTLVIRNSVKIRELAT